MRIPSGRKLKTRGLIIFVDDDLDEQQLFREEMSTFTNREILVAENGEKALELITKHLSEIFMIVSDINMPKLTGLELKRIIEGRPELKLKAIPFVFHSSIADPIIVKEAFALGIQGFILKTHHFRESVRNLEILLKFWDSTVHPNDVQKEGLELSRVTK
jgi:CheY-like chemotaxis protein